MTQKKNASMRPRVFPRKTHLPQLRDAPGRRASMRPRVFPAEDAIDAIDKDAAAKRFNEAAGIPRGRRKAALKDEIEARASMRPRVFPAEDLALVALPLPPAYASMRPRVFPAEDSLMGGRSYVHTRLQ